MQEKAMQPGPGRVLCTLEQTEKRFNRNASPQLGPLSLSINAAEILGVRGANGSGKSTLLNLIAGLYVPDGGTIRYAEGVKDACSYVPQELSLYETLSANANLRFYGMAAGLPLKAIRTRSRWLYKELGLTGRERERVSAYSGGMKRRLHLASALMVTPSLLLLDEPTVGADTASVEAILRLILHLRGMGCGIVLVTHAEGEMEKVADRIVYLESGRIVRET